MERLKKNGRTVGGFTLIEVAIVILIFGLLVTGMLLGTSSLIQSGRTQGAMSMATDLSGAARDFKQRFHFLPGDFPVDAASAEIPGLLAVCITGGANAGNGDGLIQLAEAACVPEHLAKSGYIKGVPDAATGLVGLRTTWGVVRVIANGASGVAAGTNPLPVNIANVVEFASLPCDVAVEIDSKIDDGNLATGKVRASVATCTPKGLNDPVPFLAIPL
jgi:prepilin-type N-terminal cleavage/methylation domain-containing protein